MTKRTVSISNPQFIGRIVGADNKGLDESVVQLAIADMVDEETKTNKGPVAVIGFRESVEIKGYATVILNSQQLRILTKQFQEILVKLYELEADGPPDE